MEKEKRIQKSDKKFCVLFAGILAVCFLAAVAKPDTGFSAFENRYLSKMPKLSADAVWSGSYMKDFESYVTDQFPLRNAWITMKTLAERCMLRSEINGVYFARDSYYIERHDRSELYTDLAVRNRETLVEFAGKYQEKLGEGAVKILLAPTASCVLSDKLPPLAPDDGQRELLENYREQLGEQKWVDAYGALSAHRDEEIYYRTDHHWTTLGAFYAYAAWKEKQGERAPGLSEYEQVLLTDDFLGTLYARVNLQMKPDSIYAFVKPGEELRMQLDLTGEWRDSLYAMEKLDTRDKYAVFCDGNHAVTQIETALDNGRHLLLVKDSYAHCLVPFLTADFAQISMLDLRYYNGSLEEYIEQNQVTDVLVVYNMEGFSSDRYINKLTK